MNGSLYHTIICRGETLWYEDDTGEVGNSVIIANDFELIEEQQDIDIQAIDKFKIIEPVSVAIVNEETIKVILKKLNEHTQALKQLDQKIKEG